jgi:hypothetical protein
MAHFAELNSENIVVQVIVVPDDDCKDQDGNESEVVGALFCHNLLGGRWVQTSYNHNIRKQYAGIGYFYDRNVDIFIAPQPFPSWRLDENHDWQPPAPRPEDGFWAWNEDIQQWEEIVIAV